MATSLARRDILKLGCLGSIFTVETPEKKRNLPKYLEDDVSSVRKEQIKEHLSLCPDCRRDYKRLKFVLSHLSQIEKDEIKAPPDLSVCFCCFCLRLPALLNV
ncbi:hypothetical protein HKBW3S44_00781 [Candidatus Hakubella thermalkaliphila]|uniref:Putative zinc-finger domain-containing protein n=2 Tax=Candidatus Hakubella thermalkaliphila TaxID=2754717 RepID=A0A6V8NU75_9ACTN|nr:zf-HC2 domain-containing protein [Candidatus Hakubella thermalkaliphila]MBT9171133.1 hypothetical protein [Actinomycetota bacterium]GFP23673.1 hypothetical protein HKBW3S09_01138 [Candidatus Hakubella thermalkaliphila]GFP23677.1 hypothetical protein HKBW3S09_01142 [Candidatus Hakubella thermalkaliphila]GFP37101.1 hypothetical protein HKBW3S44_00781 [Candidatus Hakubella thermalkaliphila]GFP39506.1 hypothetical protein HKBW3S47_01204 [Candidatus Hakubella thermalkaliphila]